MMGFYPGKGENYVIEARSYAYGIGRTSLAG